MKPIKHSDIPNRYYMSKNATNATDLGMFLTYLNKHKIAYSKYDIVSNIGDIICVVWEDKEDEYYLDIFAIDEKRIETTFPDAECETLQIDSVTELLFLLNYL